MEPSSLLFGAAFALGGGVILGASWKKNALTEVGLLPRQQQPDIINDDDDGAAATATRSLSSSSSFFSHHHHPHDPERVQVGTNDGSAFAFADRTKSVYRLFQLPPPSSISSRIVFLLGGLDVDLSSKHFTATDVDADSAFPWIPHRFAARRRPQGGALAAFLWPAHYQQCRYQQFLEQQQRNRRQQESNNGELDPDLVADGCDSGGSGSAAAAAADAAPGGDALLLSRSLSGSRHPSRRGRGDAAIADRDGGGRRQQQQQQHGGGNHHHAAWVEALRVASENTISRGGQRSSEDIERAIETMLQANRRRQAFQAFSKDADVPLKRSTYDQLLRTFLGDRDQAMAVVDAMKEHGVYDSVLKSGERSHLAQSLFETLSLHNWEEALSAFSVHHHRRILQRSTTVSSPSSLAAASSSPSNSNEVPVYSGLLAALIRRGMLPEAETMIGYLSPSSPSSSLSKKGAAGGGGDAAFSGDVATGLIRCLHNECDMKEQESRLSTSSRQELSLSASSSSSAWMSSAAMTFTTSWLARHQQQKAEEEAVGGNTNTTTIATGKNNDVDETSSWQIRRQEQLDQFYRDAITKSNISGHGKVACQVFANYPNPFTCTALTRFLLQHYPKNCTLPLQAAISTTLFPSLTAAAEAAARAKTKQQQQRGSSSAVVSANSPSLLGMHSLLPHLGGGASSSSSASFALLAAGGNLAAGAMSNTKKLDPVHLARLSVARAITRRGHTALALSMAQNCLKARTFDSVAPLAATVAQSGKWSEALRLGTQLFALRRTAPSTAELSLCVHASLWSGRWASALFWVERAHSRGLRFDSAVYDAAFAAATASAAAASRNVGFGRRSGGRDDDGGHQHHQSGGIASAASAFSVMMPRAHPPDQASSSSSSSPSSSPILSSTNMNTAARMVTTMAELGGHCSSESIERLIAAAAADPPASGGATATASGSEQYQQHQHHAGCAGEGQEPGGHGGSAPQIIDSLCDSNIVDWKL